MTSRINAATFDRMLVERGLTASAFCELAEISTATVAKIHRGEPVAQKTIEKIAATMRLHAVVPGIADLLEIAS